MEKYTIETSGKKITNLSAEDVVKHYQNKVTTELIGSLASTEYPETFADAEEVAQDFGDTVTKVEPTKDNAEEGGKAEFADGDESAQNFNGDVDSEKMLETSAKGTKMQVYFDIKADNYHAIDANIDELLNILESITKREDIIVKEEDDVVDNEELTHFTIEFEMYPDAAPDVIVPTLDEFEEALEEVGAEEIGELELERSECKTSTGEGEVVVIDLDGKVLSYIDDDMNVDFLDTVDEPDGGKSKAVIFDDKFEAVEVMEELSEEDYEVLPVSKAFAFVEEGAKDSAKEDSYKIASTLLKELAFDKGYTNIYEMLDKEDNLFVKYPKELAELIADKTTTEEEAGEVFEAVERMIGEK